MGTYPRVGLSVLPNGACVTVELLRIRPTAHPSTRSTVLREHERDQRRAAIRTSRTSTTTTTTVGLTAQHLTLCDTNDHCDAGAHAGREPSVPAHQQPQHGPVRWHGGYATAGWAGRTRHGHARARGRGRGGGARAWRGHYTRWPGSRGRPRGPLLSWWSWSGQCPGDTPPRPGPPGSIVPRRPSTPPLVGDVPGRLHPRRLE